MTLRSGSRESSLMRLSAMPSLNYSRSASPPTFSKGSTATESIVPTTDGAGERTGPGKGRPPQHHRGQRRQETFLWRFIRLTARATPSDSFLIRRSRAARRDRLEREREIVGRVEAVPGALLQAPSHDPREPRRDSRPSRTGRGVLLQDRVHRLDRAPRRNARTPVSISYSTAPKEKMSERGSTASPRTCSGAM